MRIAIVLNTSWNIYNFRQGLVQSLLQEGHQIIAIAPYDKYSEKLVEMGCEYKPVKLQNKGSNPFKDLQFTWQLFKIFRETSPDIVLQFTIKPNIYGTFAARLLNIPVVNNVCGLGTVFLRKGLTSLVAKLLYKLAFWFPEKVFFQNEEDLKLFVEKRLVDYKITDLVPGSGIDLNKFQPQEKPTKNKEFTFLMIARLLYDKGIMEYVEAANILKNKGIEARFQILGAVEEDANLGVSQKIVEQWVENGIIEYLGTTDDVTQYIAQADCVVLPSYREGTPRSLLEAASMAKPLIATNIAGCKQTIDHGVNGFLCEIKNSYDLAHQMEKMYKLPSEKLQAMGKASRKKVEREFDERFVIKKYLHTIAEIAQKRNIAYA
ncbi:MAG: glycosyltransferase family 4 protein [Microscillaceae bacterium]|nr:glycosyltransferase family 4 protein [Microscillaceae bacterium]MDW8461086.1 glycosyltransferase family 4 protein [Cytophagales bacterium]